MADNHETNTKPRRAFFAKVILEGSADAKKLALAVIAGTLEKIHLTHLARMVTRETKSPVVVPMTGPQIGKIKRSFRSHILAR